MDEPEPVFGGLVNPWVVNDHHTELSTWVPVGEKPYPRPLDGFGSDLLLALDDETMAVGYWSGDKFIIPDVVGPYTVTHWMPLPEGPAK